MNRSRGISARLFAHPARIGADAAVVVHAGMPLTFRAAHPTDFGARHHKAAQDLLPAAGAARGDLAGRFTDVCAIEIEANAGAQVSYHIFAEASVGTGCAGLRAIETGVDAFDESVGCSGCRLRMSSDHSVGVHELSPSSAYSIVRTSFGLDLFAVLEIFVDVVLWPASAPPASCSIQSDGNGRVTPFP